MIAPLPPHPNLNIKAFGRIFKKTTNSYKLLFFQALLILIKDNNFERKHFGFDELEQKMLGIAKYPIESCRLNFGVQDKVAERILDPSSKDDIIRWVPYRLLTPFFENELKDLTDTQKNGMIEELSNHNNRTRQLYLVKEPQPAYIIGNSEPDKVSQSHSNQPVLYAINKKHITIDLEWMRYLVTNIAVIEGWALWHWVNYLQVKNPNVPSLVTKLERAQSRQSLSRQRHYWMSVLQETGVKCIFSGKKISADKFALDHFLPWSFVGHDQLWNLVPIEHNVNSYKSDNIPNIDEYLGRLVEVQKTGLAVAHRHSSNKQWQNWSEDFVIGLSMEIAELENPCLSTFEKKYNDTIRPLAVLAGNMGFSSNWMYTQCRDVS